MRESKSGDQMFILLFILLFSIAYQSTASAQQSAVMEARVEVINGAAILPLQDEIVNFDKSELQDERLHLGSFLMKTTSSSEIHTYIETEKSNPSVKTFLKTVGVVDTVTENGEHLISIIGTAKEAPLQASSMQRLSMVVEHF